MWAPDFQFVFNGSDFIGFPFDSQRALNSGWAKFSSKSLSSISSRLVSVSSVVLNYQVTKQNGSEYKEVTGMYVEILKQVFPPSRLIDFILRGLSLLFLSVENVLIF